MGLGTPLSMPTSEGAVHAGQSSHAPFQGFSSQTLAPQVFGNQNPFSFQPPPQQSHQPTFAPHQFSHQPPSFDTFEQHPDETKLQGMAIDVEMQEQSPIVPFHSSSMEAALRQAPAPPSLEKYVFISFKAQIAPINAR